ncbi:CPBP family glutamic-type intramembrane protease [Dyella sp. 20L07]|uniref:CPBP family glutamic-type intramembrane protease n=1 Tax=Dyella sp. 20L07 TaxID=3384240 RepID=UPI003D2CD42A
MMRAIRRTAAAAGFLLAATLLFLGLGAISAWITRGQLANDARVTLTTLRQGQPLWEWALHQPGDLVAGRIFGPADLISGTDGLRITSRDGSPFELGLPLAGPVDLTHWPLLRLHLQSSTTGTLGLIYQATEFSQPCLASEAAAIVGDQKEVLIDLRTLPWRTTTGTHCPQPQVVAYMLRLRLQLPANATLKISQAALLATQATVLPPSIDAEAADIRLSIDSNVGQVAANSSSIAATPLSAPLVRLPADASSETMLTLRDLARRTWPAALILPFGQSLQSTQSTAVPPWLDWLVCAIYLTWLVWLSYRQSREIKHPWVEVAAIAAGPLWLIAGLRWSMQPSLPGVLAFVAALVYGGVSEWRRRPAAWSWMSRRPADWLWPLVPLPVALVLMMIDGHGLTRLPPMHVVAYFGWALLQQWAMLAIVLGRLQHTHLPKPVIILVTAGLFGLLHTPNGALMQLCLAAELWWAWRFMRAPRLVPIAVAHALSALLVESGLAGHMLRSLEVSARFFL